jgi:S-adenosyl methyltransferase
MRWAVRVTGYFSSPESLGILPAYQREPGVCVAQQTDWVPDSVDIGQPSTARMYDYILGGGHNLEADRALIDSMLAAQPEMRRFAVVNRAFLRRAVLFMISSGVRQFLDLGSGIPTVGNVHEVAESVDPNCRVVYVDNEPVAVAHSEMVLAGNDHAVILQADITEPTVVLNAPETRKTLDFDQPIGVLAITIGHHLGPERDPHGVFARYREAIVPGSMVAITHAAEEFATDRTAESGRLGRRTNLNFYLRDRAEILGLFGDFALVEPGLVPSSQWRPDRGDDVAVDPVQDGFYAGIGRKL